MAANRAFAGFLLWYLLANICLFEHKLCSNYVQVNSLNIAWNDAAINQMNILIPRNKYLLYRRLDRYYDNIKQEQYFRTFKAYISKKIPRTPLHNVKNIIIVCKCITM